MLESKKHQGQQSFGVFYRSNVYDKDGNIININPHFTKIFSYTLKEIRGRNIDEGMIYPADKIKEGKRLTQKVLEDFLEYETIS